MNKLMNEGRNYQTIETMNASINESDKKWVMIQWMSV